MQKSVCLKIRENITLIYGVSIFCVAVLKFPEISSQSESLEVQLPLSVMVCSELELCISTSSSILLVFQHHCLLIFKHHQLKIINN